MSGDLQSGNVYRTQPAKLAALEAHYRTGPAGLALFGIPNDSQQRLEARVEVPGLLSWLIARDASAPILGLAAFRPEHRPAVPIPFVSYRLMVGCGFF